MNNDQFNNKNGDPMFVVSPECKLFLFQLSTGELGSFCDGNMERFIVIRKRVIYKNDGPNEYLFVLYLPDYDHFLVMRADNNYEVNISHTILPDDIEKRIPLNGSLVYKPTNNQPENNPLDN